jgi:hypothetical protein
MNIQVILVFVMIAVSIVAVSLSVKAYKHQQYGNLVQALVALIIMVCGWIYLAVPNNGINSNTNQTDNIGLEITDQIEQSQLTNPRFLNIVVLNGGTKIANNCYLEVEYRTSENESYQFTGYAYSYGNNFVQLSPHTTTTFMLVRTMYDDETSKTCLMLKEIRDYVDASNTVDYHYLNSGEYYLRLTATADNFVKSSSREFKLRVLENEDAILETIPLK